MPYSVHIYIFSWVFMNCFRVRFQWKWRHCVCVERTLEGGQDTSTQDAGGPGGSGQVGEGQWRPPVEEVGKATPLASGLGEGRGESKRTRDSAVTANTIQPDGAPGQRQRWRRSGVSLVADTRGVCVR